MGCYGQVLHSLNARQVVTTSQHSTSNGSERIASLNVAAWLRIPGASNDAVALTIAYVDGGQQYEIAVDEGRVNSQQDILLSGIAHLPIRRRLEQVELRLRSHGSYSRVQVEEIFVQPLH